MTRARRIAMLAVGAAAAAAIAGCGGGATSTTTTSSTTTAPPATTRASSTTTRTPQRSTTSPHATRTQHPAASATQTTTTTAGTSQTSAVTSTSTTATTPIATATTATATTPTTTTVTTRTETAPAFVQTTPSSAPGPALSAAIAVLARHGYRPVETSSYDATDTLRVLVGAATDGRVPGEHAFFFNEGVYLGVDASAPSARITVLAHSDSEVTLGYAVAGSVRAVRFALDMGAVMALGPLPSAAARA